MNFIKPPTKKERSKMGNNQSKTGRVATTIAVVFVMVSISAGIKAMIASSASKAKSHNTSQKPLSQYNKADYMAAVRKNTTDPFDLCVYSEMIDRHGVKKTMDIDFAYIENPDAEPIPELISVARVCLNKQP